MSQIQPERPTERFRRTAAGTIVAAGLLGLRDALEGRPESEETVLESDAPGAPPPDAIELFLDPDHPERSIAVIHEPAPSGEHAPGDG